MKKISSVFLIVFILISVVSVGVVNTSAATTTVHFYNSKGWSSVNAYAYDQNLVELLGAWPGTPAVAEGDGTWYSIEVPAATPFNIIFSNEDSTAQSQGSYITDPSMCYVNILADRIFNNREDTVKDLEDAMANIDEDAEITVHFYNSKGYENVYVYVYGCTNEFSTGAWPGSAIRRDGDSYWYSVTVKSQAPFHIMFNDGTSNDENKTDVYIEDDINVYTTVMNDMKFASKEEAESFIGEPLPIPESTTAPPATVPDIVSDAETETGVGNSIIINSDEKIKDSVSISESTVALIVVFATVAVVAVALSVVIILRNKRK